MNDTLSIIFSSGMVSLICNLVISLIIFGKYREKIDTLEKSSEKLASKCDSLSDRLSKMEGGVERDRASGALIQSKSPLTLTDKGKSVLIDSKGKDYIEHHKEEFIKEIKKFKPKTAYDVQEFSENVIFNHKDDYEFNSIKDFVFKSGLPIKVVIKALSIYLRDFALEELGFNLEELEIKKVIFLDYNSAELAAN